MGLPPHGFDLAGLHGDDGRHAPRLAVVVVFKLEDDFAQMHHMVPKRAKVLVLRHKSASSQLVSATNGVNGPSGLTAANHVAVESDTNHDHASPKQLKRSKFQMINVDATYSGLMTPVTLTNVSLLS